MDNWIAKNVRAKDDKVVTKIYNKDGSFKKSVIIPTEYYPLADNHFDIFSADTCNEITDELILGCFDLVRYKIGFCYENSEKLLKYLTVNGIDATQYCGWFFVGENTEPVFHSWVVAYGNVLDLADDFTNLYLRNGKNWKNVKTREDFSIVMANFYAYCDRNHIPNHIRCDKVGVPTQGLLYIGCPCDANKGRNIYNNLIDKYPNHDTISGKHADILQDEVTRRLKEWRIEK